MGDLGGLLVGVVEWLKLVRCFALDVAFVFIVAK
jgi:hypothetical protein